MKELSLRPYPGIVRVCGTRKRFKKEYRKLFGDGDHGLTESKKGRMVGKWSDADEKPIYIVYGDSSAYLAHELSHAILHVFELVGIDPRAGDGEPFCYMLSQLLLEAE
jgi:hypothetical protein